MVASDLSLTGKVEIRKTAFDLSCHQNQNGKYKVQCILIERICLMRDRRGYVYDERHNKTTKTTKANIAILKIDIFLLLLLLLSLATRRNVFLKSDFTCSCEL